MGQLLDDESRATTFVVIDFEGTTPAGHRPEPIEVAAIADACWRAHTLNHDRRWAEGVCRAARWFAGDNDTGVVMRDDATGGAFDGLHIDGVNLNQGAESTLALMSTMQRADELAQTGAEHWVDGVVGSAGRR